MKKFFISSLLILSYCSLHSQSWYPFGSGSNYEVFAFTYYNGELIAGGIFDSIGGEPCNRIARWDGIKWNPLGSGTGGGYWNLGIVRCLAVHNGKLYAGGYFGTAGGVPAVGIASWNGTTWSSLGSGMGGNYPFVEALTVYNNELIAGGTFSTAGGVTASGIAKWNGTSWLNLGSGVSPDSTGGVYALTVFNSQLIVGGAFQFAGGNPSNLLARWTGTTWTTITGALQGNLVKSLAVYNNSLYVGGLIYQAGSVAVNNIARWNNNQWFQLGSGTNGVVYALLPLNNLLYACGYFSYAGGLNVRYVASWNGSNWGMLGSGSNAGTNNYVVALGQYPLSNPNLIIGGYFSQAGGINARRIAYWGYPVSIIKSENGIPETYELKSNYPNPFNPSTKIRFSVPKSESTLQQVKITIYDETGREADILLNGEIQAGYYETEWNADRFSSGNYFCELSGKDFRKTIKIVLLK